MPSEHEATRRWLNDIRHHIAMAEGFIAGLTFVDFVDSNLHLFAVTRCLEVISEASRRLPVSLKERHPGLQWKAMAAAGNIYRHEYEDVAAQEVWDTVTLHLLPLRAVIEIELAALEDG
jgi:uncharacterized protein with HEPN domain